jgi:hypothetical protein
MIWWTLNAAVILGTFPVKKNCRLAAMNLKSSQSSIRSKTAIESCSLQESFVSECVFAVSYHLLYVQYHIIVITGTLRKPEKEE